MNGPMDSFPPAPSPDLELDAAEELALLREIRDGVRANTPSLAITDDGVPPALMVDFPTQGSSRMVIPRKATGGVLAVGSLTVPTLVMAANTNRVAGTITNMGKADCLLILAPAGEGTGKGIALIFLVAHGGSWDLRLGPPLWAGSVSAIAVKTEAIETTELAVAEV